jgi:hypothetical protein
LAARMLVVRSSHAATRRRRDRLAGSCGSRLGQPLRCCFSHVLVQNFVASEPIGPVRREEQRRGVIRTGRPQVVERAVDHWS